MLWELFVQFDPIRETSATTDGCIDRRTQHTGAIEFVVVTMVEMPRRISRQPLAVYLNQSIDVVWIIARLVMHVDDAQRQIFTVAIAWCGLRRMIFQWSE